MNELKEQIVGAWETTREEKTEANSRTVCLDTLVLDADGRFFRIKKTTEHVAKQDGGEELYQVTATIIGKWNLEGDKLIFSEQAPRYDDNDSSLNCEGCAEERRKELEELMHDSRFRDFTDARLLNHTGQMMVNLAMECEKGNNGEYPDCHVRVEDDKLYMRWEGFEGEDIMAKSTSNIAETLDRETPPSSLQDAYAMPANVFFDAMERPMPEYLKTTQLIVPSEEKQMKDGVGTAFLTVDVRGETVIAAFTDLHQLKQYGDDLKTYDVMYIPLLAQLTSGDSPFKGVCINPGQEYPFFIPAAYLQKMAAGTFKGIEEEEKEMKAGSNSSNASASSDSEEEEPRKSGCLAAASILMLLGALIFKLLL